MMEGFIRYLCSPEAHSIREKVEFKIIPMVNVDGVVLGNFRTGIAGRDLNRMFKKAQSFEETKLI
jgi:murein tripeptide amidase MpaA